ncbi:MAG: 3-deoxy-8-phosphooctulonate synthase [Calditrichaeota bacterium]|nr:3-deoxy-8-phosphooctulonate synthase [Candidatus Cloacimonadota bacterium]MCA9786088.1 3-deoxy-8-phosphooctulonate synthase [Candidatus Cloacimonadota bacterium]MCB1048424.1 3-deoxy-8-phosphooctulonate synthase [Calditrichota bacterium]
MTREVQIGPVTVGGERPLCLIAGPCVIESRDVVMHVAEKVKRICEDLGLGFVLKSSYTKDNRSTLTSYQGPGLEAGLKVLEEAKRTFGVPVLSDVHESTECEAAAEVLDVLQIPAYLSMQSSLVSAAAKTGRVVNVKKGQFLHPADMKNVIGKIEHHGNHKILLTERGACFGYHNLVADMRSLAVMRELGYPVVFDPTHTIRKYGVSSSDPAGGEPRFTPMLTRAGVAAGIDVIFIETHPDPPSALCDAASMLDLAKLRPLLEDCVRLHEVARVALRRDEGR